MFIWDFKFTDKDILLFLKVGTPLILLLGIIPSINILRYNIVLDGIILLVLNVLFFIICCRYLIKYQRRVNDVKEDY